MTVKEFLKSCKIRDAYVTIILLDDHKRIDKILSWYIKRESAISGKYANCKIKEWKIAENNKYIYIYLKEIEDK